MKRATGDGFYWHTTPLHYVPYLLATGRIYAQSELRALGLPISPRRTAARRDRKLHLDGYVHLSLTPQTPLLTDKRRKGYPHVLFAFDAALADLPGAALCPYNAKSWRHREEFAPVTGPAQKAELFAAHTAGRYPSLELLIPGSLPLTPHARTLHVATEADAALLRGLYCVPGLSVLPIQISPEQLSIIPEYDPLPLARYAAACLTAGAILPPPDFPFD